ncbi:MAG: CBS domain-containing protein [Burkholderiaceae bacterium]
MSIKDFCNMSVIFCEADTSVAEVAALMRHHHVGDVVVVGSVLEGLRIPIGIVTDRDIVVETIALDIDAKLFTASDLMTAPVTTVQEDASLVEALALMRSKRIRRLPVVNHAGSLYGIVSSDDVINLLSSELSMIAGLMVDQPEREGRLRK